MNTSVKPGDYVVGYYAITGNATKTTRGILTARWSDDHYIVNGYFCYRVTLDKRYALKQYFHED